MKLQTTVDIPLSPWKIGFDDHILMLGSCFADSVGEQMAQHGLNVTCNPFGTLYNPLSIAHALACSMDQMTFRFHDGLWHSMAHHGAFSRPTEQEAREAASCSIETMQNALREASVVVVTFGTAWVYEMPGMTPSVVGNCHKLPETCFTRRRLSVQEIVEAWKPLIERYRGKHWLFTVSPIRHVRDGLHENQLSKATLLMAVEALTKMCKCSYFPSYEIVLDELRDYRFYADDLVHPSALAVGYIWERFVDTFCTPQTKNELVLRYKQWKHEQHRPLH